MSKDDYCVGKLVKLAEDNGPPHEKVRRPKYVCQTCNAIITVTLDYRANLGLPSVHLKQEPE